MGYFSPIKLYDMDSSPSSGSKSPSSDSKSHKGPSTVCKSPVKHRMTRRASFHDYTMPGIYMFTLQKHPEAPVLSHVLGNPGVRHGENAPRVVLSAIGCIFDEELQKTASMRSNDLVIRKYVIMPDHIHILLELKRILSRPVTNLVAIIESVTTRRCRDAGLIPQEAGVFKGCGIHDRIVFDHRQLELLERYIEDNPRRLLIKRKYPDLFRRNLSVKINGDMVDCVGNMFLLRKPMLAVHVRRKWNAAETASYKARCIGAMRQGMVLVSPFIHPVENEIRKQALAEGGSVIRIVDHGFTERFKPSGQGMDTCAEGRLLLVAEAGTSTKSEDMSYDKASRLNRLAERLAALTPDATVALKGEGPG